MAHPCVSGQRLNGVAPVVQATQQTSSGALAQALKWAVLLPVSTAIGRLLSANWTWTQQGHGQDGGTLAWVLSNVGGMVLTWLLTYYVALAVHYCGYLFIGRLVGFRFANLSVGPIKVARVLSGIEIRRSLPSKWLSGSAWSAPIDEGHVRRRMAIATAGGPLSSLLFAAAAGGVACIVDRAAEPEATQVLLLAGNALAAAALMSLFLFVMTAIPARTRGIVSEGLMVLMFLRGGAEADHICRTNALAGRTWAARQQPSSWSPVLS